MGKVMKWAAKPIGSKQHVLSIESPWDTYAGNTVYAMMISQESRVRVIKAKPACTSKQEENLESLQ